MRKSISAIALTTYSQNGVYSMVNPTIWYKPDSLIALPIDISMLPNAVFQIEITTNNQIVGSIPVPALGN